MEKNRPQLKPQRQWCHKNYKISNKDSTKILPDNKVNINNSKNLFMRYYENNTIDEYVTIEAPEHIIMEWELINFIINYTSMLYINSNYVSFSRREIEKEYEKLFSYNKKSIYITDYNHDDYTSYIEYNSESSNDEYNPQKNSSFSVMFRSKRRKQKTHFVKTYGKNGLYVLLAFRNGVTYDTTEKLWYIEIKPFLKSLNIEYSKDVDIYGFDFEKP
jgi:hypothetical protein